MPSSRHTDIGIEGIRGVAAFFVGLSHIFAYNFMDPGYSFPPLLRTVAAGHAGVLVFFVLSGYVISWTNSGPCTTATVRSYIRRRCVRLVPIYLVAMLVTLAVIRLTGLFDPLRVIVGAFLCLQNFDAYFGFSLKPPLVNGPLWSLNYEVLYYGIFLLLWRLRPKLAWVFLPALFIGLLGWFVPQYTPLFIAGYGCGWIFWSAGWWLAKQPVMGGEVPHRAPVASWILLVFAYDHINGVARVLNLFHFYSNDAGMVSINDLGMIPGILLVLSAVARRRLPWQRGLEGAAWAVCVIPIAGMLGTGRLTAHPEWEMGAGSVLLAALLLPYRSERWLRPFAWFGGISYAFYVLHFPLLYLVRITPFAETTLAGFLARLCLWLALTLGLSWILEKRFQPWIKGRLLSAASTR
jgi:peptidoglycan/LPS O-acetylase OafA/YrhL